MLIFNLRYKQGEESAEAKIFPLSPEPQDKDLSLLANPSHTASPLHFPGTSILGSAPEHYPSRLEKEPRMVSLGMKHLRKAPGFSLGSLLSSPRLWASKNSQPGLLGLSGHCLSQPDDPSVLLLLAKTRPLGKNVPWSYALSRDTFTNYALLCLLLRPWLQSWSDSGTGGGSREMLVPHFTDSCVTCPQSWEPGRSHLMNLLPLSPPTLLMCPAEKGGETVSYLPVQEAVEYSHHKALGENTNIHESTSQGRPETL